MEFRELAAKETAAAVRRARAAGADSVRQQLAAVRSALEAAAQAIESAGSADTDGDVKELVERLTRASAEAVAHTSKRLADEAGKAMDALRKETDAVRAELAAATARADKTARELTEAHDARKTIEAKSARELAEAREAAATIEAGLTRELTEARDAVRTLDANRRDLANARDAEAQARTIAETELSKVRELLEHGRAELAVAGRKIEAAVAEKTAAEDAVGVSVTQAQAAEAKLAAVTDLLNKSAVRVKQLERTEADHQRTIHDLQARLSDPGPRGGSHDASIELFDELLGAFNALGAATSIGDVLTTMMEQVATEFPRVALFRMRSSHLQGEHQIGFDLSTDIGKVVIPIGVDSLLTKAASSGQIERLARKDAADDRRLPFSGAPAFAVALPVVAGGETLAIVYADDCGAPDRGEDAARLHVLFASAILQHAVSLILQMKGELKTLAELRSYAESLISEIEGMYAADARAGKPATDLQQRIRNSLEYARSMYANRVALEDTDAGDLLDAAIEAVTGAEPQTPFGRDLAAAAGARPPDVARRRTAEAS